MLRERHRRTRNDTAGRLVGSHIEHCAAHIATAGNLNFIAILIKPCGVSAANWVHFSSLSLLRGVNITDVRVTAGWIISSGTGGGLFFVFRKSEASRSSDCSVYLTETERVMRMETLEGASSAMIKWYSICFQKQTSPLLRIQTSGRWRVFATGVRPDSFQPDQMGRQNKYSLC